MADLEDQYRDLRETALVSLAVRLEEHLKDLLSAQPRIDRVSARAKAVDRFVAKAEKLDDDGNQKYTDPLTQIQDQIGARIVTFYLSDVDKIDAAIHKYFNAIESTVVIPDSEAEFGYFGRHYILLLPTEIFDDDQIADDSGPKFFELQIKTLFQHAWSEADHDLGYKPDDGPLTGHQKRKVAFASAQAWGADTMFQELFKELVST